MRGLVSLQKLKGSGRAADSSLPSASYCYQSPGSRDFPAWEHEKTEGRNGCFGGKGDLPTTFINISRINTV